MKVLKSLFTFVCVLSLVFALASCGKENSESSEVLTEDTTTTTFQKVTAKSTTTTAAGGSQGSGSVVTQKQNNNTTAAKNNNSGSGNTTAAADDEEKETKETIAVNNAKGMGEVWTGNGFTFKIVNATTGSKNARKDTLDTFREESWRRLKISFEYTNTAASGNLVFNQTSMTCTNEYGEHMEGYPNGDEGCVAPENCAPGATKQADVQFFVEELYSQYVVINVTAPNGEKAVYKVKVNW